MAEKEIEYTFKTYNTPGLPREMYAIDNDTGLPKKVPTLDKKLAVKWLSKSKGKI